MFRGKVRRRCEMRLKELASGSGGGAGIDGAKAEFLAISQSCQAADASITKWVGRPDWLILFRCLSKANWWGILSLTSPVYRAKRTTTNSMFASINVLYGPMKFRKRLSRESSFSILAMEATERNVKNLCSVTVSLWKACLIWIRNCRQLLKRFLSHIGQWVLFDNLWAVCSASSSFENQSLGWCWSNLRVLKVID